MKAFDTDAKKMNKVYLKSYEKPLSDSTYQSLVQVQSMLLVELSREIADELIRMSKTGG